MGDNIGRRAAHQDLAVEAGVRAAAATSPITDVRGGAGYRRSMVERVVARSLTDLSHRMSREVRH